MLIDEVKKGEVLYVVDSTPLNLPVLESAQVTTAGERFVTFNRDIPLLRPPGTISKDSKYRTSSRVNKKLFEGLLFARTARNAIVLAYRVASDEESKAKIRKLEEGA